jgi:hypothetical protein
MPKDKQKRDRWSPEEVNYLSELAGTDHFLFLCQKYRKIALRNGWPYRTNSAIATKFSKEKFSFIPLYDGWTCSGLAIFLGIRINRVHVWKSKGKLIPQKIGGRSRILKSDFQAFAKAYPRSFYGVDQNRLALLLDQETLDLVASHSQTACNKAIPIYSTKTGRLYPSIRKAAKNEFFAVRAVSSCVKKNKKTRDGTGFIKLDKAA